MFEHLIQRQRGCGIDSIPAAECVIKDDAAGLHPDRTEVRNNRRQ